MKRKLPAYRPRTTEDRVAITVYLSRSHYSAMQRHRALPNYKARSASQSGYFEYLMEADPKASELLAQEQEAYAKNQRQHRTLIDNIITDTSRL